MIYLGTDSHHKTVVTVSIFTVCQSKSYFPTPVVITEMFSKTLTLNRWFALCPVV